MQAHCRGTGLSRRGDYSTWVDAAPCGVEDIAKELELIISVNGIIVFEIKKSSHLARAISRYSATWSEPLLTREGPRTDWELIAGTL